MNSWLELDLWQKLADTNNAALKDIATSQANLQGAQDLGRRECGDERLA
ncbi:hypothetical protein O9992_25865 [Vibrio lentus]|nr:hypothetical protein [Vibrio lentus]